MAERIHLSNEWYRNKILEADDGDHLIGPVSHRADNEINVAAVSSFAFGALVRLERRNRKLSVSQLAVLLDADEEEVRRIEHDVEYRARPRIITSIAKEFKLPAREVMKLAGAAKSSDAAFAEKAMRFAAHSDDVSGLNSEEKRLLSEFVNFLRKHT